MGGTTKTDMRGVKWRVNDGLIRLRRWGTDITYHLPASPMGDCAIGTDESCAIRVVDPEGSVSRRHCQLTFENGRWTIRDCDSKNGMFIDGAPRAACVLEPGTEIRLGAVTLLAESRLFTDLRNFLARILGWSGPRTEVVDLALRSVRMAAEQRASLVLCGDHDLVPIAFDLHRLALGEDKPFAMCDPRRIRAQATVRSAANYVSGMKALEAAGGGSVCVWTHRRPRDFREVVAAIGRPGSPAQLIVCAQTTAETKSFVAAPIAIPSLTSRSNEINRIIEEYAFDAFRAFALRGELAIKDRDWLRVHSATSLADIQKASRRVVAVRQSPDVASAAALLGMAQSSLEEWLGRRRLP